jgi:SSS family transporter
MPPKLRRASALLFLFLACGLLVRAEGLVALNTKSVTAEEAAQLVLQTPAIAVPDLSGAAAGLTPLATLTRENPSASEHNDDIWMLARNAAGTQVWLRYVSGTGWEKKSSPPAVLRHQLDPAGQAYLLAIAASEGEASIYTYNVITDAWAKIGAVTIAGKISDVRPATDGYVLTSRAADGSTHYQLTTVSPTKRLLSWIDWLIIVVYLLFTAGIGYYFYRKEKKQDNADFFLGGRNIPWWAAGVSLYATGTSAISYIATPAKSFATNWLYLAANVTGMIGTIIVAIWIVPLLRRLSLMSVYHYLEMRFHPKIRVLASALNILMQLGGRMSIVLFLPALAMSAVTGISVTYSILAMGVVTIVYTVLGGMKAVIWTDFIQVIVMLGGAFVAIGYVIFHLDHGAADFFRIAWDDQKFRTFDWSFNVTHATVWGFLFMAIVGVMAIPQDQVMMQRILSTKSDKEAGWSVWTLAAIVVPGNLVFYGIGTALYVFYKQHPATLNPMLNVDSVFPQFIAGQLPVGITGLIIAGIFAASMSTLSSCMNSVATLVSVDFYERYAKAPTQTTSVRLAEIITVVSGIIGIGAALLLAAVNMKSALDTWFTLAGLLGGGFAGCYTLGLFTKRTNWQGAFIGVGASIVLTFFAWTVNLVHPFFYLPLAILTCIVVGYVTSYLFPAPSQSLLGLTIFTPRKTPVVPADQ